MYGTGKWATLIGSKLEKLKVTPIYVGSRVAPNVISRKDIVNCALRGLPTFIVSSTENHLEDLNHCLQLYPAKIFVEKGFSNHEEREEAKKLIEGIVPTYVMCQHRYSTIFESFMSAQDVNKINKCTYTWKIERDSVSEYLYHLASLDGYIKKKTTEIYNNNFGQFDIDNVSSYTVVKSPYRLLKIHVQSSLYDATFKIGSYNSMSMRPRGSEQKIITTAYGEDTVGKMVRNALEKDSKIILERL